MVKKITITLRDWLHEYIEKERKKQSRSEFIETILTKYFMKKNE